MIQEVSYTCKLEKGKKIDGIYRKCWKTLKNHDLLLEDIHTSSWKFIRMSISKHVTNSWTRNDFHASSTLPCSEGDFWVQREKSQHIKGYTSMVALMKGDKCCQLLNPFTLMSGHERISPYNKLLIQYQTHTCIE